MTPDDVRAVWDGEAACFDDEPDHGLADPATRAAWRDLLLEHLPAPPARVADLGCGTGTLSVLLGEEGYDVQGLDLSDEMVSRARDKAERSGVSATFRQGDAATPGLEPATFDVVLCRHVLWAMPDPAEAVRRWTELLRLGGRMLLVEGRWFTGGGLTAEQTEGYVRQHRTETVVRHLPDPVFWGRQIDDERYLVISRA